MSSNIFFFIVVVLFRLRDRHIAGTFCVSASVHRCSSGMHAYFTETFAITADATPWRSNNRKCVVVAVDVVVTRRVATTSKANSNEWKGRERREIRCQATEAATRPWQKATNSHNRICYFISGNLMHLRFSILFLYFQTLTTATSYPNYAIWHGKKGLFDDKLSPNHRVIVCQTELWDFHVNVIFCSWKYVFRAELVLLLAQRNRFPTEEQKYISLFTQYIALQCIRCLFSIRFYFFFCVRCAFFRLFVSVQWSTVVNCSVMAANALALACRVQQGTRIVVDCGVHNCGTDDDGAKGQEPLFFCNLFFFGTAFSDGINSHFACSSHWVCVCVCCFFSHLFRTNRNARYLCTPSE